MDSDAIAAKAFLDPTAKLNLAPDATSSTRQHAPAHRVRPRDVTGDSASDRALLERHHDQRHHRAEGRPTWRAAPPPGHSSDHSRGPQQPEAHGSLRADAASDLASIFIAALDEHALDTLAERLAPKLDPRLRPAAPRADDWLDARGAASYLGLTLNALHKHTAARTIPFEQNAPGGKLWFKRDQLDGWRRGAT